MVDDLLFDFVLVVDCIFGIEGCVVVLGVGKFGYIGCKIVVILVSIGMLFYFVYGFEVSYGDLGMVILYDICILILNFGEIVELCDIMFYICCFNIFLIVILFNFDSVLM